MENKIQIFNNAEFGSVRTIEIDGNPWFVGRDVAAALGYGEGKSLANAVANHVDSDDKGVTEMMTPGGKQKMTIINESGLYSLVLSSKLPDAKKFKHWVTAEVIPSIRKNGGYMVGQQDMTSEEIVANALVLANNILANRERRIKELEAKNKALAEENEAAKHKVAYFNMVIDKNLLTNFTNTAKELHVKPKAFIDYLIDNKYIYRDQSKKKLLPYEKCKNDGLFEVKEFTSKNNQFAGIQTFVTPKGRQTFQMLLSVPGALDPDDMVEDAVE